MEEIYRDISGYEGIYQISNLGNIKRLEYQRYNKLTKTYSNYKEHYLKPLLSVRGYKVVSLCKNGVVKLNPVHRLVAETFIENLCNYNCVNHIDGDKTNNKVDNLEWCTYKENSQHAYRTGLNGRGKKVKQYDLNGKYIATYRSTNNASNKTGISQGNIYMCCVGKRTMAGNYIWKFINKEEK